MLLARLHAPFDHPDWLFELKYDGFRVLRSRQCALRVTRRQHSR
jgi:ATP-dependent DNA ligase